MHMIADTRRPTTLRRTSMRLSIGMPVYNGERFVAQAIESLLSQTFDDFDLLICDNASTDRTETICRDFVRRDTRVRYIRNDCNLGAAGNFNRVFELSNAPYFKWAAADDLHAPSYLERCVDVLDSDKSVCLCHSRTQVIDECGRPLPATIESTNGDHAKQAVSPLYDPPRRLNSTDPYERFHDILISTRWCFEIFGVMRRACVAQTDLHASYYGSDKVLLSAMALKGRFVEIPEPLFLRRNHAGTSTSMRSACDREAWMNPTASRKARASIMAPVAPRLKCLQGYCKSIADADHLPIADQARCFAAVGSYLVQPDKWSGLMRERN